MEMIGTILSHFLRQSTGLLTLLLPSSFSLTQLLLSVWERFPTDPIQSTFWPSKNTSLKFCLLARKAWHSTWVLSTTREILSRQIPLIRKSLSVELGHSSVQENPESWLWSLPHLTLSYLSHLELTLNSLWCCSTKLRVVLSAQLLIWFQFLLHWQSLTKPILRSIWELALWQPPLQLESIRETGFPWE